MAMFSWKNIKDTYNDKVKNSNSAGDKTLGILEVVGKSIVSGATAVAKEIPTIVNNMADTASDRSKQNADRVLRDSNSSQENREKAQAYLEKHSEIKEKIQEGKQKLKDSSTGYFDQDSIRSREIDNYKLKLKQLEKDLKKYQERMKHLVESQRELAIQLSKTLDDEQKIKEQNRFDQLNEVLVQYESQIAQTEAEIKKYSKKLEGY